MGDYYVNAENSAKYDGHVVVNLRGRYRLSESIALTARVMNLLDEEYAERADFTRFTAEGYRYFPAMPRHFYVGAMLSF